MKVEGCCSGLLSGKRRNLGTPPPLRTRQLALNRALQKKAVDGALLAGPRTGNVLGLFSSRYTTGDFSPQLVEVSVHEGSRAEVTGFPTGRPGSQSGKSSQGIMVPL